jgi:PAS domain S-box-containing protein
MTPPQAPLEELLRETLDRLHRQEQRTAALESALRDNPASAPAHPLTQTPSVRSAETHHGTPKPELRPAAPAVTPQAVIASLDDVVWSVSPDGQLVFFAGGAVERLYGVTEHELLDHSGRWLDALPSTDRDRLRVALARLPDTDTFRLAHRIEHASGTHRWAITRGTLVRDRDGRPLRVDGISTDVTRPTRTRDAVAEVLETVGPATDSDFLAKLVQHLTTACSCRAAVIVQPHETDAARAGIAWIDGRRAEPFALPLSDLTRDLLAGARAPGLIGARDPLLLELRAEAFAAEPLIDARGLVLGFVALADDRPFAEIDAGAVLKALAPRIAVELARAHEHNELNELEARLAAAERRAKAAESAMRGAAELATAGRIAAGVAHDFHNLLSVVVGNADLIREALPEGDPNRETAETIARTAQTVAAVSRKIMAVGRPGPHQAVPMDVTAALQALAPILRRLVGRPIPIAFDLAPALPFICADPIQFDRVVLNLMLNARDALGDTGGSIAVRAAVATIEPDRPGWPADRPPGRYIAVTVADTGAGMPPEVRARMFELFFTTKGDRGTGMGLATVHEAVTLAGGHVEVESEVGWGTQVRVYWPALVEPSALKVRG